jgi:FMN phosphatase YigB (HAD superfamily)
VAVRAVVFDVGETLVDEDRYWREVAQLAGLRPHVVMAALGVTIARGEEHSMLWERLGVARPPEVDGVVYRREDLYADALPCLEAVAGAGYLLGAAGNQTAALEEWTRGEGLPFDFVTSSASLGVRKPAPAFFEQIVALSGVGPAEVAYVGDRVDNDVLPAAAAGLVAVHLRRGPWGLLQETPREATLAVDDLATLPEALASLP